MINQQRRLDEIKKGPRALVVIDFKMKHESKFYRGKTTEFFGKRGVEWHGAYTVWFEYVEDSATAAKKIACCDQILQDGAAVSACEEALVAQLKDEVPVIETVTLALPSFDRQVNWYSIFVDGYVHTGTEAQDGKGMIDAHFAKGSQHVDATIGEGNDAATPRQVFI